MSEEEYPHHNLSPEERNKIAAQVDYFLHILSRRYNTSPEEVVAAIQWVKERKEMAQKFQTSAMLTTIGIVLTAVALAVWEGIKTMVLRPK